MVKFKGKLIDANDNEVCEVEGSYRVDGPTPENAMRSWHGQFSFPRGVALLGGPYRLQLQGGETFSIIPNKQSYGSRKIKNTAQFTGSGQPPSG